MLLATTVKEGLINLLSLKLLLDTSLWKERSNQNHALVVSTSLQLDQVHVLIAHRGTIVMAQELLTRLSAQRDITVLLEVSSLHLVHVALC